MKQKSVIIIMGPPGSGKGTQAQLLSEKISLYYLDTARVIDTNLAKAEENDIVVVEGKKYSLAEQVKLRHTGKLMSTELITYWVEERIRKLAEMEEGFVLTGSPRTLYEGEKLSPLLKELYGLENIEIIVIDLPEEESIRRNTHRRICSLMKHPVLYSEETKNLTRCSFDGSKLVIRKDDNVEAMKTRIKVYKERTLPLVEYLKKEGFKVKEVKGKQTPEELHYDILKLLE